MKTVILLLRGASVPQLQTTLATAPRVSVTDAQTLHLARHGELVCQGPAARGGRRWRGHREGGVSRPPSVSEPGALREGFAEPPLSVYNEDTEPPAEVLAEISSVAVKSVAGMEPVPGGATRKINQVRACSSLSFLRSPTGNPIHRSCSGSRAHRVPVHGRHDARSHGLL